MATEPLRTAVKRGVLIPDAAGVHPHPRHHLPGHGAAVGHGIQPIGLWAHDWKSGKTWKVSEVFHNLSFPRPASPVSRAYVLVPIEQVPVRVEISGTGLFTFGVSPGGCIAYAFYSNDPNNKVDTGLRVVEPSGTVVQVDPSGSHPEFSPHGEYLAATQWRPALGNEKLIVYRTAALRR